MSSHDPKLTSSEIAVLWSSFMNLSMVQLVLAYWLEHVDDSDIRSVLEFAYNLSRKQFSEVNSTLEQEHFSLPHGFTNDDVNMDAPRLFSDVFYLHYMGNISKIGMAIYGVALSMMARRDLRTLYKRIVSDYAELYDRIADVLLTKGVYIRPPVLPVLDQVDYITKRSFMTGFLGERRPINVIEISHIFANIDTNVIGKSLLMGFSQTAQRQEVREYMVKGVKIASKHIQIFSQLLEQDDIPAPMAWDTFVENSIIAPFSDRLMMSHVTMLVAAGTGNYASGAAASLRHDLSVDYIRLSAEIGQYAAEGTNILIEHGWMEQPPQAPDRKKAARMKD